MNRSHQVLSPPKTALVLKDDQPAFENPKHLQEAFVVVPVAVNSFLGGWEKIDIGIGSEAIAKRVSQHLVQIR